MNDLDKLRDEYADRLRRIVARTEQTPLGDRSAFHPGQPMSITERYWRHTSLLSALATEKAGELLDQVVHLAALTQAHALVHREIQARYSAALDEDLARAQATLDDARGRLSVVPTQTDQAEG